MYLQAEGMGQSQGGWKWSPTVFGYIARHYLELE